MKIYTTYILWFVLLIILSCANVEAEVYSKNITIESAYRYIEQNSYFYDPYNVTSDLLTSENTYNRIFENYSTNHTFSKNYIQVVRGESGLSTPFNNEVASIDGIGVTISEFNMNWVHVSLLSCGGGLVTVNYYVSQRTGNPLQIQFLDAGSDATILGSESLGVNSPVNLGWYNIDIYVNGSTDYFEIRLVGDGNPSPVDTITIDYIEVIPKSNFLLVKSDDIFYGNIVNATVRLEYEAADVQNVSFYYSNGSYNSSLLNTTEIASTSSTKILNINITDNFSSGINYYVFYFDSRIYIDYIFYEIFYEATPANITNYSVNNTTPMQDIDSVNFTVNISSTAPLSYVNISIPGENITSQMTNTGQNGTDWSFWSYATKFVTYGNITVNISTLDLNGFFSSVEFNITLAQNPAPDIYNWTIFGTIMQDYEFSVRINVSDTNQHVEKVSIWNNFTNTWNDTVLIEGNLQNGIYQFNYTFNYFGPIEFIVNATDNFNHSNTTSFIITLQKNPAPNIYNWTTLGVLMEDFEFSVRINVSDTTQSVADVLIWNNFTNTWNDTVLIEGNSNDGTYEFNYTFNYVGPVEFIVNATDNFNHSNTTSFIITLEYNPRPQILYANITSDPTAILVLQPMRGVHNVTVFCNASDYSINISYVEFYYKNENTTAAGPWTLLGIISTPTYGNSSEGTWNVTGPIFVNITYGFNVTVYDNFGNVNYTLFNATLAENPPPIIWNWTVNKTLEGGDVYLNINEPVKVTVSGFDNTTYLQPYILGVLGFAPINNFSNTSIQLLDGSYFSWHGNMDFMVNTTPITNNSDMTNATWQFIFSFNDLGPHNGVFNITFAISDDLESRGGPSNFAISTIRFRVSNPKPTLALVSLSNTSSVKVAEAVTVIFNANDTTQTVFGRYFTVSNVSHTWRYDANKDNATSIEFSYSHTFYVSGIRTLEFNVTDNFGEWSTLTVVFNITNPLPTHNPVHRVVPSSVFVGQNFEVQFGFDDSTNYISSVVMHLPDGQVVSLGDPISGSKKSGVWSTTAQITDIEKDGTHLIPIIVTDDLGGVLNYSGFSLQVLFNLPPSFSSLNFSMDSFEVDKNFQIKVIVTDASGIERVYARITKPNGEFDEVEFSPGAKDEWIGNYEPKAKGDYVITVYAQDPENNVAYLSQTIHVEEGKVPFLEKYLNILLIIIAMILAAVIGSVAVLKRTAPLLPADSQTKEEKEPDSFLKMQLKEEKTKYDLKKGYVSSGVTTFDKNILKGGIPKSYVISLGAPNVDESDLFITRFLREGLENGEKCILITDALTPVLEKVLDDYPTLLTVIIAAHEAPKKQNIMLCEQGVTSINIALLKAISLNHEKVDRLVITVLTPILFNPVTRGGVREFLKHMKARAKKYNATVLASLNTDTLDPDMINQILDQFDGVFVIKQYVTGLYLSVLKLSGINYENTSLLLDRSILSDILVKKKHEDVKVDSRDYQKEDVGKVQKEPKEIVVKVVCDLPKNIAENEKIGSFLTQIWKYINNENAIDDIALKSSLDVKNVEKFILHLERWNLVKRVRKERDTSDLQSLQKEKDAIVKLTQTLPKALAENEKIGSFLTQIWECIDDKRSLDEIVSQSSLEQENVEKLISHLEKWNLVKRERENQKKDLRSENTLY